MAWIILLIAGCFETTWAVLLKYSHGFSRLWPSVFTVMAMVASVYLLGVSVKSLPLGTAYAVWTGIGAVGTSILGMVLFHDPRNMARIVSLTLILAGIVGLKFFSGGK